MTLLNDESEAVTHPNRYSCLSLLYPCRVQRRKYCKRNGNACDNACLLCLIIPMSGSF